MALPREKVPIPLDYSSPAEEQRREKQIEDDRAKALGDYNESTFGERHPFSVMPIIGLFVIVGVLTFFLPNWAARLVRLVALPGFLFWQWYRRR